MPGSNGDGQSAVDYIAAQARAKLEEATAITQKASDEGRPITTEERTKVTGLLEDVSGLKLKKQELEETAALTAQIDAMNANQQAPVTQAPAVASIGDAFIQSDAYKALQAQGMSGKWTTGPIEMKGYGGLGVKELDPMFSYKADVTETLSPIVVPQYLPGIVETLFRRLTVQDLIASGTTTSNQVTYAQETTATNAAAPIAEAAAKPESAIVLALVNEAVRKIATFLPVSDEMLEDVAQIRSYLESRLRLFVQHTVEAQLLNGTGTAPQIRGLLNRTGVQTVVTVTPLTAQKAIDAIYQAMTDIRSNAFLEPDAVVIHPTNYQLLRTARDTNGQYYAGGPFMGPYGQGGLASDNVWGLPAIVTSAITAGTVLVGAFRTAAQAFFRTGLTVEASNSHSDFFQRNMTALRAEQRLALAVYRPAGFSKITLTA
jgi:HK97 family phage major capsid protein